LDWVLTPAKFSLDVVEQPGRFPDSWRQFPHSRESQDFGATWAREQRSAVLRMPSALVAGEFNYLLNPLHPDFKRVKIGKTEPFAFDARLSQGGSGRQ
jgi:RES domain-containing protein